MSVNEAAADYVRTDGTECGASRALTANHRLGSSFILNMGFRQVKMTAECKLRVILTVLFSRLVHP